MREDIFRSVGVEILLPEAVETGDSARGAFLKIAETLTRMGQKEGDDTLRQLCYILHKQGRYVIAHLSEMRWLDGDGPEPTLEEIALRNRVALLLERWELLDLALDEDEELEPLAPTSAIKVLPYRDKKKWHLRSDYKIGRRDGRRETVIRV
jgi:Bacteriophage translational regulator